ncbi:MAG: hypothetical protein ACREP9_11550, partial [Candidatus Dormibacteraceae bacterium]
MALQVSEPRPLLRGARIGALVLIASMPTWVLVPRAIAARAEESGVEAISGVRRISFEPKTAARSVEEMALSGDGRWLAVVVASVAPTGDSSELLVFDLNHTQSPA